MKRAMQRGEHDGGGSVTGVLGVVLAGGLSRRMGGGDKCLLNLGGRTLLDRAVDRLAAQLPDGGRSIVLNANGAPERFGADRPPVVADSVEGFAGPLAGVLAGLDHAAEIGAERIVTVAADTPFFPHDLLGGLEEAARMASAPLSCAATRDEGGALRDHPTFGLWPTRLREDLRHALTEEGVRKVIAWTDRHRCARAEFPVLKQDGERFDPFFNVNTPDDMQAAQRFVKQENGEATG